MTKDSTVCPECSALASSQTHAICAVRFCETLRAPRGAVRVTRLKQLRARVDRERAVCSTRTARKPRQDREECASLRAGERLHNLAHCGVVQQTPSRAAGPHDCSQRLTCDNHRRACVGLVGRIGTHVLRKRTGQRRQLTRARTHLCARATHGGACLQQGVNDVVLAGPFAGVLAIVAHIAIIFFACRCRCHRAEKVHEIKRDVQGLLVSTQERSVATAALDTFKRTRFQNW